MNTTQTTRPGRHNKTTLTLTDFEAMEKRVEAIDAAISALVSDIISLTCKHEDDQTRMFLASAMKRVSEAQTIEFNPYWWHPQPEWTGGDSSDPKNTVWNEPHIVKAFESGWRAQLEQDKR